MSRKKRSKSSISSSSSGSNSSSDSDSSSGSSSDSSSSSSSPSPKKSKKSLSKPKPLPPKPSHQSSHSSDSATSSSATLVGDNAPKTKTKKKTATLLVADAASKIGTKLLPATKENLQKLKREQVPFSRIPTDTKIDPKFSSNKYVSYDYADRAYNDLSVTKGRGFTKEKNKKKRGMSTTTTTNKRRRLEAEYAGLLEAEFMESDGRLGDYNPFGFPSDSWDFMHEVPAAASTPSPLAFPSDPLRYAEW